MKTNEKMILICNEVNETVVEQKNNSDEISGASTCQLYSTAYPEIPAMFESINYSFSRF